MKAEDGRGTKSLPMNRFDERGCVPDPDHEPDQFSAPNTTFIDDASRSIIAFNDSPDVGFNAGVNPYRGCEHGCIYCYARPTHEYFGFSAGLDFETKIMVKHEAPNLLRAALAKKSWKPQTIAISGVTDCYQPIERKLALTRRCLEVLAEFNNPVAIITKNHLVARDADILGKLAAVNAAAVHISLTTLDVSLNRVMEPRTSLPQQRLEAISRLRDAGIPVGVLLAPVIPGLTDHEIPQLLDAAAKAGAGYASFVMLRLPFAVAPLFEEWLGKYYPLKKDKVLNRLRDLRGGRLNDPNFSSRMRGEGIFADQIAKLFKISRDKAGLAAHGPALSISSFRRPGPEQLDLC